MSDPRTIGLFGSGYHVIHYFQIFRSKILFARLHLCRAEVGFSQEPFGLGGQPSSNPVWRAGYQGTSYHEKFVPT